MTKKRSPKEIHVDKLIVKANEVIIVDESRRHRRDPWLGRVQEDDIDVDVDVKATAGDDVDVDVDVKVDDEDDKPRRPFSWI